MTQIDEIRHVIDRYAAAWSKGDRTATAACYHDDFTLHYFGRNALSGDHAGKAASLKTLAELGRRTHWRLVSVAHTLAGPTRGAILTRVCFGQGDKAVEVDRILIFRVQSGLLRECWAYDQDQQLLDELIGSE